MRWAFKRSVWPRMDRSTLNGLVGLIYAHLRDAEIEEGKRAYERKLCVGCRTGEEDFGADPCDQCVVADIRFFSPGINVGHYSELKVEADGTLIRWVRIRKAPYIMVSAAGYEIQKYKKRVIY